MNREDLSLGQEVLILSWHDERRKLPPSRGVVIKIGRKLVTVAPLDEDGNCRPEAWPPYVFRIDEQTINDDYGHVRFQTSEQYAREQAVEKAVETLHQHGLERRLGRNLTDDKLLAVVKFLNDYEAAGCPEDWSFAAVLPYDGFDPFKTLEGFLNDSTKGEQS